MYESFDQICIETDSVAEIEKYYNQGYVFTRLGKGIMQQIKSVRVKLADFELSSENRRILKKNDKLKLTHNILPSTSYSWAIAKLAKDFYGQKFGKNIMSANKIKEMFSEPQKSNMNAYFEYSIEGQVIGYCLLFESNDISHYSYPFYDLEIEQPNLGMAMMLQAIIQAQEKSKQYIYLGSDSKYKHQFKGLEVYNPETKEWE